MAERKRIGIPFSYTEGWIAGTYYITNLIHALNLLDDPSRPEIFVLSNEKKDSGILNETGYPYLKYLPVEITYNYVERIVNKLSRILLKRNTIRKEYCEKDFDIVFPYINYYSLQEIKNKLYWKPDFQEKYFPEFFSKKEIDERKVYLDRLASSGSPVVFSSENARNDFYKFYPANNCKTFVLNFASTHPEYNTQDVDALKMKYDIKGDYFISPNQFWEHKNHFAVLKAIKLLKNRNLNFIVVFTGKEQDYRNPNYFERLKKFVDENNLNDNVRFLGFIDRKEQLKLMSSALAVIQPSLFEGWSTVVEDAKEMNQYVILSDIGVHREQLDYNVSFFNPNNENELSDKMVDVLNGKFKSTKKDYKLNVQKFGNDFMKIINEVLKSN